VGLVQLHSIHDGAAKNVVLINPPTCLHVLIPHPNAVLSAQLPQRVSHLLPKAPTHLLIPTPPPPLLYVKTLAARVNLPASVVKAAVELLERNRRVLFGKNPWVSAAAALWLASFKKLGLLKALAEAAGTTPTSIRNASNKMRV
jgi:hypothetical protein